MKLININDKAVYPKLLTKLPDAPSLIYAEGNLELLNSISIAIVGSRRASEKGIELAQKFASELSSVGITIVSGLARGIDTAAHTYSYNKKGKTIAVLGTGLNEIYPPENKDLSKKIISNGGLVISELDPKTNKKSSKFKERNRIISGLSLGVLIIEAKYKSGTGITARYAARQHKPIFVLPHEIDNPHGAGTNRLLKNGAIPVTDTIDILNKLKLSEYKKIYENQKTNKNIDSKMKINTLDTLNSYKTETNFQDSKYTKIFNLIKKTPMTPNDLTRKTKFSINEIQSILFFLEINGYIKKSAGGYICT